MILFTNECLHVLGTLLTTITIGIVSFQKSSFESNLKICVCQIQNVHHEIGKIWKKENEWQQETFFAASSFDSRFRNRRFSSFLIIIVRVLSFCRHLLNYSQACENQDQKWHGRSHNEAHVDQVHLIGSNQNKIIFLYLALMCICNLFIRKTRFALPNSDQSRLANLINDHN